MKKLMILLALTLSFAGYSASNFEIIGGSCWECRGGSFKTGQIECTPERTARLYEVSMNLCTGSNPRRNQVTRNTAPKRNIRGEVNNINAEIERLQRKLSRLKSQNNSL